VVGDYFSAYKINPGFSDETAMSIISWFEDLPRPPPYEIFPSGKARGFSNVLQDYISEDQSERTTQRPP
jgi:hypothetical protein